MLTSGTHLLHFKDVERRRERRMRKGRADEQLGSAMGNGDVETLQNMMLDIPLQRRSEIIFLDDEPFFDYIGNLPQCI